MQTILVDVNWLAVVVGSVISFIVGAIWYAPSFFGTKWKQGLGTPAVPNRPMVQSLLVEAVSCFLLAWLLALLVPYSIWLAVLAALTAAVAVKANDMFSGKSNYTIATETGYMLVKAAIVILVLQLM